MLFYTYNPKGKVLTKSTLDACGNLLKKEAFQYKGNLLIEKIDAMGLVTTYTYDSLGRKIEEKMGSKTTSFAYDDFDRLIQVTQSQGAIQTYTYDWLNRVTSKTLQDAACKVYGKETYLYDIQGNEIEKKVLQEDNVWITYRSQFYSDGKILWQEDPLGNRTTFTYDHNHINDQGQKVLSCTIQDAQLNIVALYNSNSVLVQYSRFSPFGEESLLGDTSIDNPWRFANRRNIQRLSLFAKRFYNPQLMRWQTPDPLGFEDGLNLYTFVHNNPLRYHDPDGQVACFLIPIFTYTFGVEAAILLPSLITLGKTAAIATAVYAGCYVGSVINQNTMQENLSEAGVEVGGYSLYNSTSDETVEIDTKEKYRDPNFPGTDADLENHPDWNETSHPKQRKAGHREMEILFLKDMTHPIFIPLRAYFGVFNMNLEKYSGFFHDGSILDIQQNKDNIMISMETAQIYNEWNEDKIQLSHFNTIKGILHLEKVRKIIVDDNLVDVIKMSYDDGEILDFKIKSKFEIELLVVWMNYAPKDFVRVVQSIEIQSENIYWENIPTMKSYTDDCVNDLYNEK